MTFDEINKDVKKSYMSNHMKLCRQFTGLIVTMTIGKYSGRKARIGGILIQDGHILFCCLVLRADGSGKVLNSDMDSRSFHKRDYFELLTDKCAP